SLASAPEWGSGGRRFKSSRPDLRKGRHNNQLRRPSSFPGTFPPGKTLPPTCPIPSSAPCFVAAPILSAVPPSGIHSVLVRGSSTHLVPQATFPERLAIDIRH